MKRNDILEKYLSKRNSVIKRFAVALISVILITSFLIFSSKSKNFIAGSRLNLLFSNSNAVNIGIASDISKYHKIVFMWRDSAFNYSVPYTKTFEPKSSSSILELSEDYFADDYEQEENVLVLN